MQQFHSDAKRRFLKYGKILGIWQNGKPIFHMAFIALFLSRSGLPVTVKSASSFAEGSYQVMLRTAAAAKS